MAFFDSKIEAPPHCNSPSLYPVWFFFFIAVITQHSITHCFFTYLVPLSPTPLPTTGMIVNLEQAFYAEHPAPTTEPGTRQLLSQDLSNVTEHIL